MSNAAIVFDLDDTLINTSKRHYNLVSDYLSKRGILALSYEQYIFVRKHNKLSNAQLLKRYYPGTEQGFEGFWIENIESSEYLHYDTELVNRFLLRKLKDKTSCSFILLSLRSNVETAEKQFSSLTFSADFSLRYFLAHALTNPKAVILEELKNQFDELMFIGDSHNDWISAETAGVEFRGVNTGFYTLDSPNNYSDVNQLLETLLK